MIRAVKAGGGGGAVAGGEVAGGRVAGWPGGHHDEGGQAEGGLNIVAGTVALVGTAVGAGMRSRFPTVARARARRPPGTNAEQGTFGPAGRTGRGASDEPFVEQRDGQRRGPEVLLRRCDGDRGRLVARQRDDL